MYLPPLEFSFNKDLQTLSSWLSLTINQWTVLRLEHYPLDPTVTMIILHFLMMLEKILRVTLDKDLSYKEHISAQLKKAFED